jgi:hypothetical protein
MYSHLVQSAIKPAASYTWFIYTGRQIQLPYRGIEVPLEKGQKIGVRKSADGKKIRLVMDDEVNRVFTLDLTTAQKIAKFVKGVK